VVDVWTDLSRGSNQDVIFTDNRRKGEKILGIVNIYDLQDRQTPERHPRTLN